MGTHPKQQNPSRIQAQRVATWSAEPVPFSTFEPAKSKGGWVGLEALAGIGWVDVTALGTSHSKGTSQPPAPPVSTHAKQQNPSRIQAQRVATWSAEPVPFSTFEPAKSKGGWVRLEALAGIGWVDVTALGSIVGHQPLEHACETAACKGWWPMNASVGTCTGWPKMRWCSHWTELARRQGSQCFTLPLRLPLR